MIVTNYNIKAKEGDHVMHHSESICLCLLVGGRCLVSQKGPIRLMQIYDIESAKMLLLMSLGVTSYITQKGPGEMSFFVLYICRTLIESLNAGGIYTMLY